MAFSDSRLLLRNIAGPWKSSPRVVASKNGFETRLSSTPPVESKTSRRLLPSNLLAKFKESCKSPYNRVNTESSVCTLTRTIPKCVLDGLLQPSTKIVKETKEIGKESVAPSVDTPNRIHILRYGFDERQATRRLGQGSFGTIFQAKYKGDTVAVKLIPSKQSEKSVSLKKEENALNLSHPNIVQVLQVISTEHNYGIVIMELCCGLNLNTLLQDSTIEVGSLKRINFAIDIASAIQHCHNNQILHLDIKPQNIIVGTFNLCKLCDFGSSHILEDGKSSIFSTQILGTLIYTDPEILQKRCASKQSDIYSYGITLWQLLSREIPYSRYNLHKQTIIYKVVSQEFRPRDVLGVNKDEKDYIHLYKLCWQQKPSCRPPSIFCVIQELERIRSHMTSESIND